jgi:hypothetical protein
MAEPKQKLGPTKGILDGINNSLHYVIDISKKFITNSKDKFHRNKFQRNKYLNT